LRGGSPRRVRASHPPVSSLASVAESKERRTRQTKRRQRILQAVGVVAHPEVLVQLRDKLATDAEGFSMHRRQHRCTRFGEGVEVRRSPQAMACRKRYVGELGRPSRRLPAGGVLVGCTALEARKGKPGHGVMPGPKASIWNAGTGRRRSTVKGKARRMPRGSLIRHSTRSMGKPCTGGRT